MRFFNTTGPVVAEDHYCVPPLERLNLAEILGFVRSKRYFVLHAPRQTGKTSALLALRDRLNSGVEGAYRCVYVNVEVGQAAREDKQEAMRAILAELEMQAALTLGDESLTDIWPGALERAGPSGALSRVLTRWAAADPKPLVLLVDEIDSLVGDTLISVLRQLRAGYTQRPRAFPQSVILCGVRDVRDYRLRGGSGEAVAGGSAFNVSAKSLRLGDFSRSEMLSLLTQHTAATGQAFDHEALDGLWNQTLGQPWLVNALAYEACFGAEAVGDREVTFGDIIEARERIIGRRETHLDQLADKLREERVRRVVEPLLSHSETAAFSSRDLEYARDLGLIARGQPPRMANPIYAEVVPRELTAATQEALVQDPAWYVDADGGLDMARLLAAFQDFFREHSEHWVERFAYREAGPQLLLQAFLQRIVNGGGRIEREYGLGRGRTDLIVFWPRPGRGTQRFVVECKLLHEKRGLEATIREGVAQTAGYMDRSNADAGHLVIFDRRRPGVAWGERILRRQESAEGVAVDVWGM